MSVKSILFKLTIKGTGGVNFDSGDQKYLYNRMKTQSSRNDNNMYHKGNYYEITKSKDGVDEIAVIKRQKISSNCLRHYIYKNDIPIQSVNNNKVDNIRYDFSASFAGLTRGYLFVDSGSGGLKRTSCLQITDAEEIKNDGKYTVSNMEQFTKSGEKTTSEDTKSTSIFKRETFGDIKYLAKGNINLDLLQFLSTSPQYDRQAFLEDEYKLMKPYLEKHFEESFPENICYYKKQTDVMNFGESGILLDSSKIKKLVKYILNNLINLYIHKSQSGYAEVEKLEIKFVEDVLSDRFNDDDGWKVIKNKKDIDNVLENFEPHIFLEQVNENHYINFKKLKSEKDKEQNSLKKEKKDKDNKIKEETKAKKTELSPDINGEI
jgi:hypothetical protein